MLFGYDTVRLSWGYALRRATAIGLLNFYLNIGRYPRVMCWNLQFDYRSSSSRFLKGFRHRTPLDRHYDLPDDVEPPCGRLMKAVWKLVRSELQLRAYDRATAALCILKRRLPIFDDRTLCEDVLVSTKPKYTAVANYLNKLSLLNISILSEMNWFLKTAEMARVYGIQFYE
ncbi:unnamed protein product, partial [Strongylus vulgaris]